jgi:hypothetical protein
MIETGLWCSFACGTIVQYGTDLAYRKNSIIPVRPAGESCSDRAEISEIFPVGSLIINNNSIFSTFLFIYLLRC